MKKFISLVLALVMALSLTTVAWAADVTVTNSTELQAAVNDSANAGKTIKLTASATPYSVTLTSASADNLTIEGVDGAVMSYLEAPVGYEGTFTVKKCTFDVPAITWCYACLQGKYNVTFDTCTFKAGDMDSAIYVENGYDDAVFTLKDCTFYGTYVETPVVLSNSASHTFAVTATGNTFVGNDGGLGIYAKDSTMTLNTDEENVTHLAKTEAAIHAAVAVANAGDTIKLRNDGTNSPMTLATLPVLSKPITIDANDVTLANFPEGENITTDANGNITGGTFATTPNTALAPGYAYVNGVVAKAAGQYVGSNAALTSSTATYGATLDAALANKTHTVEVKPALAASPVVKSFATYQVFVTKLADKTVSVLPNQYIVVPTATNADIVVVDGNKIVYLAQVSGATNYDDDAKAVKVAYSATPKCGDVYVAAAADAGTYYLYKNAYYVECNEAVADKVFNVDGVAVAVKATNVVKTLPHTYGYDVKTVNGTTTVTSVYCKVCKATFSFVEGDVATAVKTFGAGNYADTGLNNGAKDIFVLTGYSVGTPVVDTDKVESAETFDAGIAMYVGMSVMAAAGSAVVLKKKD